MNRKNKKQRRKKEEALITRLDYLRKRAIELQSDIETGIINNKKQFHIRNLKFFKNTCNLLVPFVICTGCSVGLFSLLGLGFPIVKDDKKEVKIYTLDYETEGTKNMKEEYCSHKWYDDPLPDNELTIYTPWKQTDDNCYYRYKWTYEINNATSELMDAVLREDFNYIDSKSITRKKEQQIINIPVDNNGYYFDAYLTMIDKDDVITYPEDDSANNVATVLELGFGLGLGLLIAFFRDFSYFDEMRYAKFIYRDSLIDIDKIRTELNEVNNEISTLSKKKVR